MVNKQEILKISVVNFEPVIVGLKPNKEANLEKIKD